MPWRRFSSAVSGERSQASVRSPPAPAWRRCATGAEGGVDGTALGHAAEHGDTAQVHQLAQLLEADLDLALRHHRGHRRPRAPGATCSRRRSAHAQRSNRRARCRWGRWNSRCARRQHGVAQPRFSPMSGRGAPAPRPPRPSAPVDTAAGNHWPVACSSQRVGRQHDDVERLRRRPRLAASTPPQFDPRLDAAALLPLRGQVTNNRRVAIDEIQCRGRAGHAGSGRVGEGIMTLP